MATLKFREATTDDLEFAWEVYARKVASLISGWTPDAEKKTFTREWSAHDNKCVIQLDGEDIGWFSCVTDNRSLLVNNLHVLADNPGIPSAVLNILVLDGRDHDQKVSLRLLKNDPAMDFFRGEDFPAVESADGRVTVDASFQLNHWQRIWRKKLELPWNKNLEDPNARVPA